MLDNEEKDPVVAIADAEMARITAEKSEGSDKANDEVNGKAKKSEGSESESSALDDKNTSQGDENNESNESNESNGEGNDDENDDGEIEFDDEGRVKAESKTKINKKFSKLTKERNEEREARLALEAEVKALREGLDKQKKDIDQRLDPPEKKAEIAVKKALVSNVARYLEEDKDKPLEERREMSKEDLEQWLIDEPVDAQDWMLERKLRIREETAALFEKEMKKLTGDEDDGKALREENNRVALENKDIDFIERSFALSKEGKTPDEILESLRTEFPLFTELEKKNPKKYLVANGLSLLIQDYREAQKGSGKVKETAEEAAERLRQEGAIREKNRQDNIDEGLGSETNGNKKVVGKLTDVQKKAARMANMTDEEYLQALKRQKKESGGY